MATAMGLGLIGSPNVVIKRKFRWGLEIDICAGQKIFGSFVKVAARPNLEIEEQEINFRHGKFWIPGKATWQAMTVTYYDVGGANVSTASTIFAWIASVYDVLEVGAVQALNLKMGSPLDYEGTGHLELYDGCGETMEEWTISGMWPQAVNFGELDMSSSEEVTIELTCRYKHAQLEIRCGVPASKCNCTPCNSGGSAF